MMNRRASEPLPLLSPGTGSPTYLNRRSSIPSLVRAASSRFLQRESSPFQTSSRSSLSSVDSWIKLVYVAAIISWIATYVILPDYNTYVADLETQLQLLYHNVDYLEQDLNQVDDYLMEEMKMLTKLKKTRTALDHEVRMIREIEEGEQRLSPSPKNQRLIQSWLDNRTDMLKGKVNQVQRYLQALSRTTVKKNFGNGPFRVEFTVDMIQLTGKRNLKRFVVETFPLEEMPHSTELFLDTVQSGLWDNTVFLHHEDIDHVIAAAPIDHSTQRLKNTQLNALGWINLGFPEYSDNYQHEQYTLGFAGQGPTFYFNTLSNVDSHGPGGQGHHLLPDEADPCFARVVEGFDTVDDLVRLGNSQKRTSKDDQHPWADDEHTWTHVVSVKLV